MPETRRHAMFTTTPKLNVSLIFLPNNENMPKSTQPKYSSSHPYVRSNSHSAFQDEDSIPDDTSDKNDSVRQTTNLLRSHISAQNRPGIYWATASSKAKVQSDASMIHFIYCTQSDSFTATLHRKMKLKRDCHISKIRTIAWGT